MNQITKRRSWLKRRTDAAGMYDELTGTPNRALFMDRLEHGLTRSNRAESATAVLVCDIDNFKLVNDSLGHRAGDEILVKVLERLRSRLRQEDTAARISGDVFAIAMEQVGGWTMARTLAWRLADAVAEPLTVRGQTFFLSLSVGVAVDRGGMQSADELIRAAEVALHRGKAIGKGRVELFTEGMLDGIMHRLHLETDLRRALESQSDELTTHYQPKIAASTGNLIGVEALVRWHHPERGMLLPGEFIPVAEESGLIGALGARVLRQACRDVALWEREHGAALTVAVNVSTRQLQDRGFVAAVRGILGETGLPPRRLILEITEGTMCHDDGFLAATLDALKDIGVQLAIDDFGVGYSSLDRLRRFPVDEIKIDRCFVSEIVDSAESAPLVTAVIALARGLGHRVVAEGVETQQQLEFLRRHGCDEVQGYLIAVPGPAQEMCGLLAAQARVFTPAGS